MPFYATRKRDSKLVKIVSKYFDVDLNQNVFIDDSNEHYTRNDFNFNKNIK